LQRGDHQHATARPTHLERHADLRLDAERSPHADQLLVVLLQVAGHERLAGLEDLHGATAVGDGQHIEPVGLLSVRERLIAGADGDQRVTRRVVQERVDLVGAQSSATRSAACDSAPRRFCNGGLEEPLDGLERTIRRHLHDGHRSGPRTRHVAP
jgi:hypothetical protein